MSDTEKRDAVLKEFSEVGGLYINTDAIIDDILHLRDERQRLLTENAALRTDIDRFRARAISDWAIVEEHAKERQRLTAAVERVRAMHAKDFWGLCRECHGHRYPCPTLRALEETP